MRGNFFFQKKRKRKNKVLRRKIKGTNTEEENKRSKGEIKDADSAEGKIECMREKMKCMRR